MTDDSINEMVERILHNDPFWYVEKAREFKKARPRIDETQEQYDTILKEYILGCHVREVEDRLRRYNTGVVGETE